MKIQSSIKAIYAMHKTMIYTGFPMWWIMDDDCFDFGAVVNDILIPQRSWRGILWAGT